jgi:hypothetical protein
MVILIPDNQNLPEVEEMMTEEEFKNIFNPKANLTTNDQVRVVDEKVNMTLPIIDSTYINHHLDKSVLKVIYLL